MSMNFETFLQFSKTFQYTTMYMYANIQYGTKLKHLLI